jgi:TIR domain
MKARLFLSYRRKENKWAVGHVRDRLYAEFGIEGVFFDNESIDSGESWKGRIEAEVKGCSAVVMVYGSAWAGPLDDGSRRIDNPDDVVRFELVQAHRHGKPILPVVIDEALPPSPADLPADLQFLSALHFGHLSAAESLDRQTSRLIMNIRKAVFGRTMTAHYLTQALWIALLATSVVWLLRVGGVVGLVEDGFARTVQAVAPPLHAQASEQPAVVEINDREYSEIFGGQTPLDPEIVAIFFDALRERSQEAGRCDARAPVGINVDLAPGEAWADSAALAGLAQALRALAACRPVVMACPQRIEGHTGSESDQRWVSTLGADAKGKQDQPVRFASTRVDPLLLRHGAARTEIGAVMADLAAGAELDWNAPARECVCPATHDAIDRCTAGRAQVDAALDRRSLIVPFTPQRGGSLARAVLPGSTIAGSQMVVVGAGYGVQGRYSVPTSQAEFTAPVTGSMVQAFIADAASLRPWLQNRWLAALADVLVAFVTSSMLMTLWRSIAVNVSNFPMRLFNYLGVGLTFLGVPLLCVGVATYVPAALLPATSAAVVAVATCLRSAMSGYEVLLNGGVGWKFFQGAWAAMVTEPHRWSARTRFAVLCVETLVIAAGLVAVLA